MDEVELATCIAFLAAGLVGHVAADELRRARSLTAASTAALLSIGVATLFLGPQPIVLWLALLVFADGLASRLGVMRPGFVVLRLMFRLLLLPLGLARLHGHETSIDAGPVPLDEPFAQTGLVVVAAVLTAVFQGGLLVAAATRPFLEQLEQEDEPTQGLENGGRIIGLLERFLVTLLMLLNAPTAIGFLITAKSILRFGEISEPGHRKMTEYIIIGTLASFAWAIATGAIAGLVLQALHSD